MYQGDSVKIEELAEQLGINIRVEFDPKVIVPEESIRAYCRENRCGNYENNYMCPPLVGSLDSIRIKLQEFQYGLLLQYAKSLDVKNDWQAVRQTKVDFHRKILQIEELFKKQGINRLWGFIGGSCGLCDTCKAKVGEPCLYPDQARTSLEAIAVNVVALLDKLGLDYQTW